MTGDFPTETEGVSYVHRLGTSASESKDGRETLSSTTAPETLDLFLAFGGATSDGKSTNEVRAMDCATSRWVKLTTKGAKPSKRMGQAATLVNGRLFVHGGRAETAKGKEEYFGDAYELDLTTLTWRKMEMKGVVPSPRAFHTVTALSSMLVCFGGDDGKGFCSDTFIKQYNKDEWHKTAPFLRVPKSLKTEQTDEIMKIEPPPRACHTANALADGDTMIMFGGLGINSDSHNDVWAFSAANFKWAIVDPPCHAPEPRFMHTTTVVGDGLVVLGGAALKPLSQSSQKMKYEIFGQMYLLSAATSLMHPKLPEATSSKALALEAAVPAKAPKVPTPMPEPKKATTTAAAVREVKVAAAAKISPPKPEAPATKKIPIEPVATPSLAVPASSAEETDSGAQGASTGMKPAASGQRASNVPPKKKLSAEAKLHRMTSDPAVASLPMVEIERMTSDPGVYAASVGLPSTPKEKQNVPPAVVTNPNVDAPQAKASEKLALKKQKKTVAVAKEVRPVAVAKDVPPVAVAKDVPPAAVAKDVPPVAVAKVDPPIAVAPQAAHQVAVKDALPVPGVALAPPDDEDEDVPVIGQSTPSPPRHSPAKSLEVVPIPGVRMAPTHDNEWDDMDSDERVPSLETSSDEAARELSPSEQPFAWVASPCGKSQIMIDRVTGKELQRIELPIVLPPSSKEETKRLASPDEPVAGSSPKRQKVVESSVWTAKERHLARKFFEQFEFTDHPRRYSRLKEAECEAELSQSWARLSEEDRLVWLKMTRVPLSISKSAHDRDSEHDEVDSEDDSQDDSDGNREKSYLKLMKRTDDARKRASVREEIDHAASLSEFRGGDVNMLGESFRGVVTEYFDSGYFATLNMESNLNKSYRVAFFSPPLLPSAEQAPEPSLRPVHVCHTCRSTTFPLPAHCVPAEDETDVENVLVLKRDGATGVVRARDAWGLAYVDAKHPVVASTKADDDLEPID